MLDHLGRLTEVVQQAIVELSLRYPTFANLGKTSRSSFVFNISSQGRAERQDLPAGVEPRLLQPGHSSRAV